MPRSNLDALTPEHQSLIPAYLEKWKAIALSTQRIDRAQAVQAIYAGWGLEEKEIRFFDSPYDMLRNIEQILPEWERYWPFEIGPQDVIDIDDWITRSVQEQIDQHLVQPLESLMQQVWQPVIDQLYNGPDIMPSDVSREIAHNFVHDVLPQDFLLSGIQFDFCVSVLGCSLSDTEQLSWQAFQRLVEHAGWILPLYEAIDENDEKVDEFSKELCWICDPPVKLCLDSEGRLHADAEPAIEFADGFAVWAQHGELWIRESS
ncbi:hypothetical protein [Trichocoleus sp. FACHB-262]|uniref:hypothetical protein n=1 Tax=Trichocoleus sp. FACHB-262 TaxID=2692869 RepID=UPI0016832F3A|nr:hypothetical protein [Trichocoleus sp. FACHB-262]MBD2122336.1 hypothetical protein [Trichocoleus sp. FACHB-262]